MSSGQDGVLQHKLVHGHRRESGVSQYHLVLNNGGGLPLEAASISCQWRNGRQWAYLWCLKTHVMETYSMQFPEGHIIAMHQVLMHIWPSPPCFSQEGPVKTSIAHSKVVVPISCTNIAYKSANLANLTLQAALNSISLSSDTALQRGGWMWCP